jgi:addiction module HigA family antidote
MIKNLIHPGEFLQEELDERGITQSDLAKHIGVAPGVISLICNGKHGISANLAKKLAVALGTTPRLWMNLQSSYELGQAEDPDFGKLRA